MNATLEINPAARLSRRLYRIAGVVLAVVLAIGAGVYWQTVQRDRANEAAARFDGVYSADEIKLVGEHFAKVVDRGIRLSACSYGKNAGCLQSTDGSRIWLSMLTPGAKHPELFVGVIAKGKPMKNVPSDGGYYPLEGLEMQDLETTRAWSKQDFPEGYWPAPGNGNPFAREKVAGK